MTLAATVEWMKGPIDGEGRHKEGKEEEEERLAKLFIFWWIGLIGPPFDFCYTSSRSLSLPPTIFLLILSYAREGEERNFSFFLFPRIGGGGGGGRV